LIGGWVGPRAGLDAVAKRKIPDLKLTHLRKVGNEPIIMKNMKFTLEYKCLIVSELSSFIRISGLYVVFKYDISQWQLFEHKNFVRMFGLKMEAARTFKTLVFYRDQDTNCL
jgi:hypothetical protein